MTNDEFNLGYYSTVGDLETIKKILAEHPEFDINQDWSTNVTLLQEACARGHVKLAVWLNHPDIDPNRRYGYGHSPLSWACLRKDLTLAKILLADPRVDATATDLENCTALWWSARWGLTEAVKILPLTRGESLDLMINLTPL